MGSRIRFETIMSKDSKDLLLFIASGNLGKIKEFKDLFSLYPLTLCGQPDGFQVEETGQTFQENARLKALAVAKKTGSLSLADDSGLSVDSLGGEPGVHSARYAKNDEERIRRLLSEMEPFGNRYAHFTSALCIASPDDHILIEVEGRCDGVITKTPRGENGFGYDPIFEVKDTGLTFAEMETQKKLLFGHRGNAFKLLEPRLKKYLGI